VGMGFRAGALPLCVFFFFFFFERMENYDLLYIQETFTANKGALASEMNRPAQQHQSVLLLRYILPSPTKAHFPPIIHLFPFYVKLLVKVEITSFSLASRSLLSAPSLSMVASKSDSLVFKCERKSASHCKILATGTLSNIPFTPA